MSEFCDLSQLAHQMENNVILVTVINLVTRVETHRVERHHRPNAIKDYETVVFSAEYHSGHATIVALYDDAHEATHGHLDWSIALDNEMPDQLIDLCNDSKFRSDSGHTEVVMPRRYHGYASLN